MREFIEGTSRLLRALSARRFHEYQKVEIAPADLFNRPVLLVVLQSRSIPD
jgi:hypothetical protein